MKNVSSDVAYRYLRQRILSGEYPPGQALILNTLSAEIGVSRTPVRDALRQLEADGLVVIQTHLGASVKSMDMREFREACVMRLALESFTAGLAAQFRTDKDLQEIGAALAAMRKLTDQILASDHEGHFFGELVREDVGFHIAIITAAKNELMKKEILRLHLINRVVSATTKEQVAANKSEIDAFRRNALSSHEEIYKAIVRGDAPAAKAAMERHIQDIIDASLLSMASAGHSTNAKKLTDEELLYTSGLRPGH